MPSLILTTAVLVEALLGQPIAEGKATRYREGLMQEVVANRVRWRQIDPSLPHVGYVALADRQYLGRRVVILAPTGYEGEMQLWGPMLVADTGAEKDQQHLEEIGFAVDLSYELAQAMLMDIDAPLHGVKVYLWDERASDLSR